MPLISNSPAITVSPGFSTLSPAKARIQKILEIFGIFSRRTEVFLMWRKVGAEIFGKAAYLCSKISRYFGEYFSPSVFSLAVTDEFSKIFVCIFFADIFFFFCIFRKKIPLVPNGARGWLARGASLCRFYFCARSRASRVVSPKARFQSALKPAMEASVVVCERRRDITSAPTVAV